MAITVVYNIIVYQLVLSTCSVAEMYRALKCVSIKAHVLFRAIEKSKRMRRLRILVIMKGMHSSLGCTTVRHSIT